MHPYICASPAQVSDLAALIQKAKSLISRARSSATMRPPVSGFERREVAEIECHCPGKFISRAVTIPPSRAAEITELPTQLPRFFPPQLVAQPHI